MTVQQCDDCGKSLPVFPLHGDRGGPKLCSFCMGAFKAKKEAKARESRRFLRSFSLGGHAEEDELSLELLTDALKLTHPDLHPPERQDLAHRVTAGLLALKPYALPAPSPPALSWRGFCG